MLDPNAASPALSIRQLSGGYGSIVVLHDVSLSLLPGTITAVIGTNGAGKSTLCAAISGLLPDVSGMIELGGEDLTGVSAHDRCRRGLLFAPESRGIFPTLSVKDNLRLLLSSDSRMSSAYDSFPRLYERRDQPAGSLSGGEQQMLTMAPLLVDPPRVLLADEPTLGLAPGMASRVLDLCRELRDRGTALLLVEEKAAALLEVADHAAVLRLGSLVWEGSASALDGEALRGLYLGSSDETAHPARAD